MNQRNIFFALGLLFAISASGQDINTNKIVWKVDSLFDLKSTDRFAYSCEFETSGQQLIIWKQSGGFNSDFKINSVTGNWTNLQWNGSITYSVTYEDENGTLLFERSASGIRIRLVLGDPSQPSLKHEYYVSAINPIP
ncbi:MAG: hypothetical protein K1X47_05500 [Cyclobacteriaceae bacterium]|nr:hypothetical protein [Cyclobacteriaceae bacterium]